MTEAPMPSTPAADAEIEEGPSVPPSRQLLPAREISPAPDQVETPLPPVGQYKEDVRYVGDPRRRVAFEDLVTRRNDAYLVGFIGSEQSRYLATLSAFEKQEGNIAENFWSAVYPAGLALTTRKKRGRRKTTAIHRYTNELTRNFPVVAGKLYEADNLAYRCEEVLRGSTQHIALGRVYGSMCSLLTFVERCYAKTKYDERTSEDDFPKELKTTTDNFDRDLRSQTRYYSASAATTAQLFYFWGMFFGALTIAILTGIGAFLVDLLLRWSDIAVSAETIALAVAAVSAGAVGAAVSALWRMSSGAFKSNFEAGSEHLRMIGSFRPFIGAMFGLFLFFAIEAGVLSLLEQDSNNYLIILIAFVGGFSERLAPDFFARPPQGMTGFEANSEAPASGTNLDELSEQVAIKLKELEAGRHQS